jgi:hypothetical protein
VKTRRFDKYRTLVELLSRRVPPISLRDWEACAMGNDSLRMGRSHSAWVTVVVGRRMF